MQLSFRITWVGSGMFHTAHLTAAPGTSGAELGNELARRLGTPCTAVVSGVHLSDTRVGTHPLTDGATVVLSPREHSREVPIPQAPVQGHGTARAGGMRTATETDAAHSSTLSQSSHGSSPSEGPGAAQAPMLKSSRGVGPIAEPLDVACLVAVEGVGAGTRLPLTRGTHEIDLTPNGPRLLPMAWSGTSPAAPTLIMDQMSLRVLPARAALSHGDRVRVQAEGRECTLEVAFHAPLANDPTWLHPGAPPAGFTAQEADPTHPLRVHSPAVGKSRIALITGLLPLVAGIVIAMVTQWWFFLVFSALGAITCMMGWLGERGVRRDHTRRMAVALERDLLRCERAAPSAAQIVAHCRALERSHHSEKSTPGAPPAQHHKTSVPVGIDTQGESAHHWVRLGHTARPAIIDGGAAVPRAAFHPHAPVLLNLMGTRALTLVLDRERATGVLNALAVQLFTGPAALGALRVCHDIAWRPPMAHDLLEASRGHEANATLVRDRALEVVTPGWAAATPPAPGTLRIIVTADPECAAGDAVVTAGATRLRLRSRVVRAVPGLQESGCGTHLEFTPDTVTFDTARAAIHSWQRTATRSRARSLPRRVESHELLVAHPSPTPITHNGARRGCSYARSEPTPLAAVFGVSRAGPEFVRLDDENPHLLVAGTTGCGKSEVLRTLVTALAHDFPPERLEFVFIDFKGGAALAPLTGLPHITTLLTDLGPEEVRRALAFLRSELQRRERVLSSLGLNDMAQLLRTSGTALPLRELVVVVDEARMLTDAFPDTGQQLAMIAAVGRSLGVHLVLATQRPQGALSADVRANITQALCLRVRSDQESTDVLGTTAAARIAPGVPGRGLLDRGDGPPEEVQVAVLTRMIPPRSEPLVLRFDPGPRPDSFDARTRRPHLSPASEWDTGVASAVHDVSRVWHRSFPPTSVDVAVSGAPADAAVPAPLPRHVCAARTHGDDVDLGAAENPAAHWCGRVSWHPWQDGPLLLIGRPEVTRIALREVLWRGIHLRIPAAMGEAPAGVAVYVLTASAQPLAGLTTVDGRPLHPSVRGCTRAADPGDVAHLVRQLHAGIEQTATMAEDPAPRAILAVDDWDHCCQILRASTGAHLEDELMSLMATGATRGLSCLVAGDRVLTAGRASHLGPNRLYFPQGHGADSLAQWPRLPPFTPYSGRAALAGPMATRCTSPDTEESSGHLAVVQLATGLGPAPQAHAHGAPPRTDEPTHDSATTSTGHPHSGSTTKGPDIAASPWPTAFPLPAAWSPPDRSVDGLVLGVTRDGQCAVHPWGPGSTLIIAGPARSGRSSFLEAARAWLSSRPSGCRGGEHLILAGAPRSAAGVEQLLRAPQEEDRPITVLIDDADHLSPDVLRALAGVWFPQPTLVGSGAGKDSTVSASAQPGVRLIVSVRLTDALAGTFAPLLMWRQHADALLVQPRRVFDGDVFGVPLTGVPLGGPPGRAVWVHRGLAEPLQMPAPAHRIARLDAGTLLNTNG